MASSNYVKKGAELALDYLRYLPRVNKFNVRGNPGDFKVGKSGRGDGTGGTRGHGNKGAKQRCSYPRLGYENGQAPFYLRIPKTHYYTGHHLRRQYPPLSLGNLQLMIDTGRIDPSQPIDLNSLCNTKLYVFEPFERHFGIHLTDEGVDGFTAKVNIEVQHAKESVIAAVERNGGVILNAYYDIDSLMALRNAQEFFEKGKIIPHRKLPPEDAVLFYTDAKSRGYLADPEKIAEERFVLSQKYGYKFMDIREDPLFEMLSQRKDPRQVFFGLEPGWAVSLSDKTILKPKAKYLQDYYQS